MKTGLIDVGGGMRDIYGAGVLDKCLEWGIRFDHAVGVSAGSANICSFLAEQRGRNYRFYTEYAFRKDYMSLRNYLRSRNFIDLDYIYDTLSGARGEYPLDFARLSASGTGFTIVATDALTGKPHYFELSDMAQDHYDPVKASSCVPGANRPYVIGGTPYFDGGIADPIPLDACFARGCDRIVLILTRPKSQKRDPNRDTAIVRLLKKHYPACAEAMRMRAETYNASLDRALSLEKEGRLLVIAPDDIGNMSTLTRDHAAVDALYQKGLKDAEALLAWFPKTEGL